jgi:hypothetical protein
MGRILLLPTGPGDPKSLGVSTGIEQRWGYWLQDGRGVLLTGKQPGKPLRSFIQSAEDVTPSVFTPEGAVRTNLELIHQSNTQ